MKLKTRVEYVYPSMAPRMVEAVAHMGIFHRIPTNEEILNWSETDFFEHTLSAKYRSYRKFDSWQKCANIYTLDLSDVRWDDNMVVSLAEYLCNNPDVIPYFIEKSTVDIIGLFMGAREFNTNSSGILCIDRPRERFVTDVMYSNAHEFRRNMYDAQRKFSLFANVISRVLDKGINLEEVKIVQVFSKDTYANSKGNPWYEGMIFDRFVRADGMRFTKEELTDILSFVTLSEFFDCVEKVANLGSLSNFTLGEVPPLKTVKLGIILPAVFDNDIESYNIEDFGDENLVLVSEVCQEMREKLAMVKESAENRVLVKHLERLNEELSSKKDSVLEMNYSSYKSTIDSLFEEIVGSTSRDKETHLNRLIDILKSFGIEVVRNDSVDPSLKTLTERVEDIDKRLNAIEVDVSNIKKTILEYLEHGGDDPLQGELPVTREEVLEIISNYEPKTIESRRRKIDLLKSLKVLAVGATLAGVLTSGTVPSNPNQPLFITKMFSNIPSVSQQVVVIGSEKNHPVKDGSIKHSDRIVVEKEDNLKPIEEIVIEVIVGNWKNGEERITRLIEAGYDQLYVQENVNLVLIDKVLVNELRSTEDIAIEVVQGKWGADVEEQMSRLSRVGYNYDLVRQYIIDEHLEESVCQYTSKHLSFNQQ